MRYFWHAAAIAGLLIGCVIIWQLHAIGGQLWWVNDRLADLVVMERLSPS